MLMFADTSMSVRLFTFLAIVLALNLSAQRAPTAATRMTLSEYETVLRDTLPCPTPTLRDTTEFQLCLLILPPGHRLGERELLVTLRGSSGAIEMTLMQPKEPLWQSGHLAKAAGLALSDFLSNVKVRRIQERDPVVISRVVRQDWRKLNIAILPQSDWYTDATSYRLHVHQVTGTMSLVLTGPGAKAQQPSSVLVWAEHVRKEAERILQRRPAKEKPAGR